MENAVGVRRLNSIGHARPDFAAGRLAVVNPATGETVGDVADLSPAGVRALVNHAREVQPAWAALEIRERARLMRDLRAWMVRNRKSMIEAMMGEAGKTYDDALLEVFAMAHALGFWARHSDRYLREERGWTRSPLLAGRKVIVRYEPLGVVGVIGPWNYPLLLGLGDALPALMAGNSVVLKPSSVTPLSSVLIVDEGMREVGFPEGVCTVATGAGGTGSVLVDSADMIMFTGSTEVGKGIGVRAAERMIPVSLELGGKDPMIVLGDADLDLAANEAVFMGMFNAGQTCMSVERVYVEAPAYEGFVARVVERVQALRQGPPGSAGMTDVGAQTGRGQVDIIERHVNDAVAKGARVLAGGRRGPGENYFEPTVIVDVDDSMDCMVEETFGPTLPIVKVQSAEEAIGLANASQYGLNSSVFTADVAKGEAVARRLESGASCVNAVVMNYLEMRAPFGGWKASGAGVGGRHGPGGIRKFCREQTVLVTRWAPTWNPMGFPRRPPTAKFIEWGMVLTFGRGGGRRRLPDEATSHPRGS